MQGRTVRQDKSSADCRFGDYPVRDFVNGEFSARMNCSRCQHDNPSNAKFCLECGARLTLLCAKCQSELPSGAKFCLECGEPIASRARPGSRFAGLKTYTPKYLAEKILTSKAALEGERKQVTVLFADLKGSMELLADRDPEEARKLLDPVIERMMESVHHYEGTVNQVMGDGIMALFGAPLATGLNLSHKLSFARSWGPLQRGDPPWHTSPREPVPMPRFGTARRARCQR